MLAEAADACFYAGDPAEMLARRGPGPGPPPGRRLGAGALPRATAVGMARVLGGDAAAGAEALSEAIALAEGSSELREDLQLMPWLVLGPIFLRESGSRAPLLEHALKTARARAGGRACSRSCST